MLFSIITCVYNSEKYLSANIKSVKSQYFNDYEHIFIDGKSTDNTLNILNEYQKTNSKNIHIYQYPPKGIADAMNKGIIKAKGKYIIHLHADDSFYSKDILSLVAKFLENNNYPDWIYGKAIFSDLTTNKSRVIPHRKIYSRVYKNLLLLTNYIPHQAVFIKKSIFKKFGLFDETFRNSMDYEYWLKISNKTKSKFFPEIVCNFSVRPNSQSCKYKNLQLSENLKIKKIYISNPFIRSIINFISIIDSKRKLI